MTRLMAIVVVGVLGALFTGCSSSSSARVAPGANAVNYRHRSVAQKFADFAKQGWTVASKELEKDKKGKAIAGTNGMIMRGNPYESSKANPLNNAVWSTNFKVADQKAEKMQGVNIVRSNANGSGAVNVVNGQGVRKEGNNGVNVKGPAGMSAQGNVPQHGRGGMEISGPVGVGSAKVGTNNGMPTVGTVNVMGPDGKVHSVRRDLGQDAERLMAPMEKSMGPVLSR